MTQLEQLERFYDAVPRPTAAVEEVGPLTLFLSRGPFPYYARPRLGEPGPISVADVARLRARQRELGVPEALEWVHETTPELLTAARAAGLEVLEAPLLVLDRVGPSATQPPAGVALRLLEPQDPALPAALATVELAFADSGVASGPVEAEQRDRAVAALSDVTTTYMRDRLASGRTVMAVAEEASGPVAAGSAVPLGDVAEVVGVGTLPSLRRRGIAAALTALLAGSMRMRGIDVVFLSAQDEAVARIYERVGFRRTATACIASRPSADPDQPPPGRGGHGALR